MPSSYEENQTSWQFRGIAKTPASRPSRKLIGEVLFEAEKILSHLHSPSLRHLQMKPNQGLRPRLSASTRGNKGDQYIVYVVMSTQKWQPGTKPPQRPY